MNGNMHVADRAALPAVARLYADNILNEPAIPPLLRDMADEIARLRITDAEREALERICEAADDIIDEDKRANGVYWQDDAAAVAVVRGLLERLGGGR